MTTRDTKQPERKVVLITGASSGFGRMTASLLAKRGYRVFGTSRNPDTGPAPEYEMLPLDVRSDESAKACVRAVMERAGRLGVLVNNAGYGLAGALEEISIQEAKEQFETNFFGVARMVKEALPVMRKQGHGQIITIGSLAGLMGVPLQGLYSASKHALEGYMETLRHEVKQFNIRVSIVEPSFFKTNFAQAVQMSAGRIADYDNLRSRVIAVFKKSVEQGEDPALVAKLIVSIIESRSPRLRYRIGRLATWLPRVRMISSQAACEAGTRKSFHLDDKEGT